MGLFVEITGKSRFIKEVKFFINTVAGFITDVSSFIKYVKKFYNNCNKGYYCKILMNLKEDLNLKDSNPLINKLHFLCIVCIF